MRPPAKPRRRTGPEPANPDTGKPKPATSDRATGSAAPKKNTGPPRPPKPRKKKKKQSTAVAARPRASDTGTAPASQDTAGPRHPDTLDERRKEKRRATARLWLARAAIGLLIAAVIAGAVWLVGFSRHLALDPANISIEGAEDLVSDQEILEVMTDQSGVPLVRINTGDLEDGIDDIAAVGTAVVTRSWPTGMSVTVTEREPVAAAPQDDGWVLLDREGVQLGVEAELREGIPEVTVPLDNTDESARTLDAVLTTMADMPDELREQIGSISAQTPASIEFTVEDSGATVLWGAADESELKAEVLLVLLQDQASVYDVTAPRAPTTS